MEDNRSQKVFSVDELGQMPNEERLEILHAQQLAKAMDCISCTYTKGYILQPVYACRTCYTEEHAGFCLTCSMNCHIVRISCLVWVCVLNVLLKYHDVIELYNKRNFRCDCGNEKFRSSLLFKYFSLII